MIHTNKLSSQNSSSSKQTQYTKYPQNIQNEDYKQNTRAVHNKSNIMGRNKALPTINQNTGTQSIQKTKHQSQDVSIFKKYFNSIHSNPHTTHNNSTIMQHNSNTSSAVKQKHNNTFRFSNIIAQTQKYNTSQSLYSHAHTGVQNTNNNQNKTNQIYISQFIPQQPHPQHKPLQQTQQLPQQQPNPNIFDNINRIVSCKRQTQSLINQVQFYIGLIDKFKKENKYYKNLLVHTDKQNKQLRDLVHQKDLHILEIKEDRDRYARLYAIEEAKVAVLKDSCREVIETKWGQFMQQRIYRQTISQQHLYTSQTQNPQHSQTTEQIGRKSKKMGKNKTRINQTSQSSYMSSNKQYRNDHDTSFYTNNSNYSHLLYDNINQSTYNHAQANKKYINKNNRDNPQTNQKILKSKSMGRQLNKQINKHNQQSINISRLLKQQTRNTHNPHDLPNSRKSGKIIRSNMQSQYAHEYQPTHTHPHNHIQYYQHNQQNSSQYQSQQNIQNQYVDEDYALDADVSGQNYHKYDEEYNQSTLL